LGSSVRWRVAWTERALKDADRLDPKVRQRIIASIDRYAADEHGDVVRLEAMEPPEWRLRVGAWRIRFRRDTEAKTLYVFAGSSTGQSLPLNALLLLTGWRRTTRRADRARGPSKANKLSAMLDEIAAELRDAPALSDEAVSRAGIYADHP